MKEKIWLIGGTSDSRAIAKLLLARDLPFLTSVVTTSAISLYPDRTEVIVGSMERSEMEVFCWQNKIKIVIDASHPYAIEVSQNAIAVASELNLAYLRYERDNITHNNFTELNASFIKLDSFKTLIEGNYLNGQKVLLAIGCKALPLFQAWHDRATLFARILPKRESLQIAQQAGFTSDRLIAMRPPFNLALEKALWQQWQISLVVTKASGRSGGEDIKYRASSELNIPLIVIDRPLITYPQQTFVLSEVIEFCRAKLFFQHQ